VQKFAKKSSKFSALIGITFYNLYYEQVKRAEKLEMTAIMKHFYKISPLKVPA